MKYWDNGVFQLYFVYTIFFELKDQPGERRSEKKLLHNIKSLYVLRIPCGNKIKTSVRKMSFWHIKDVIQMFAHLNDAHLLFILNSNPLSLSLTKLDVAINCWIVPKYYILSMPFAAATSKNDWHYWMFDINAASLESLWLSHSYMSAYFFSHCQLLNLL